MIKTKEVIVLNILEFLLSKKILVVLSGLIFTSVAVASSGAESLFQENGLVRPETKIPEVQNITNADSSPAPTLTTQQPPQKSSPISSPKSTTKPTTSTTPTASITPAVNTAPKPVATSNLSLTTPKPTTTTTSKINASPSSTITITGLRQTGSRNRENEVVDEKDDKEDESDVSEINRAFQEAKEED